MTSFSKQFLKLASACQSIIPLIGKFHRQCGAGHAQHRSREILHNTELQTAMHDGNLSFRNLTYGNAHSANISHGARVAWVARCYFHTRTIKYTCLCGEVLIFPSSRGRNRRVGPIAHAPSSVVRVDFRRRRLFPWVYFKVRIAFSCVRN